LNCVATATPVLCQKIEKCHRVGQSGIVNAEMKAQSVARICACLLVSDCLQQKGLPLFDDRVCASGTRIQRIECSDDELCIVRRFCG
jgi:hypothetical protein